MKKLQNVKRALISWQKLKSRISERIKEAQQALDSTRSQLAANPSCSRLFHAEKKARDVLNSYILAEESMMRQKSRETNLNLGDGNNRYFYSSFKPNRRKP